jgi:hypothetical protein
VLWPHEWPLWQGIVARIASDPELAAAYADRARAAIAAPDRELHELHRALCPDRYAQPYARYDVAFLEPRPLRPLPAKTSAWLPDDRPVMQPYLRFACDDMSLLVLDRQRLVAELPLVEGGDAIAQVIEVMRAGRPTVAEIGHALECEADEVAIVLTELARKRWVGCA